jgi:site-specific recombinase XerC
VRHEKRFGSARRCGANPTTIRNTAVITATPTSSESSSTARWAGSRPDPALADLLAEYLERFSSHNGRLSIHSRLRSLFQATGTTHPRHLTTRHLLAWITDANANNSVRARLSTSRAFLRWCVQTGLIDSNPADLLPNITKQYPTTYGKVQSTNPARFLTHTEAFGRLVPACQDGTEIGLRDEIIIRLGLSGMRLNEIATLTLGDIRNLPTITWVGKGNRPRQMTAGPTLAACLQQWLALRDAHGARTDSGAAIFVPVIPATTHRNRTPRLHWRANKPLTGQPCGPPSPSGPNSPVSGTLPPTTSDAARRASSTARPRTTADTDSIFSTSSGFSAMPIPQRPCAAI